MTQLVIDLMRHGEPEGGARYRGHGVDDPLSAHGWEQMWRAVGEQCPWHVVVSSPMRRCREFGATLAQRHGLECLIETRFKEVGFGAWEGRLRDEVRSENAVDYRAFYQDPVNRRPAGAEPMPMFLERVQAAYSDLIRQHSGRHLLVLAHAGVIRALMAHVLQIDPVHLYRIKVTNACFTRICDDGTLPVLEFHNLPTIYLG